MVLRIGMVAFGMCFTKIPLHSKILQDSMTKYWHVLIGEIGTSQKHRLLLGA